MTDCFKTGAPNAEATRPAASDSGAKGYFKNFSSCEANDGTPITADWANTIIDSLTEIVAAAKAAEPTFDDTDCSGILVRAIQELAPSATGGAQYFVLSDDGQAAIDAAPIGSFYLDDVNDPGGFYHKVPNAANSSTGTWVEYVNLSGDSGGGGTIPSAETFDTSGTWTKPDEGSAIILEMWGGGGGGGASAGVSSRCGGGAGGQYQRVVVAFSELSATVNFVIGAGGTEGNDGGTTTFGDYSAIGGGAGSSGTNNAQGGLALSFVNGVNRFATAHSENGGGGGQGAPSGGSAPTLTNSSWNAGGGGSGGSTNIGASAASNLPNVPGGKGGAGGQGGAGDRDPEDGQVPGGGGGGRAGNRASGSGGGGRIVITVI